MRKPSDLKLRIDTSAIAEFVKALLTDGRHKEGAGAVSNKTFNKRLEELGSLALNHEISDQLTEEYYILLEELVDQFKAMHRLAFHQAIWSLNENDLAMDEPKQ